jgi:hypothetical protein
MAKSDDGEKKSPQEQLWAFLERIPKIYSDAVK